MFFLLGKMSDTCGSSKSVLVRAETVGLVGLFLLSTGDSKFLLVVFFKIKNFKIVPEREKTTCSNLYFFKNKLN